MEGKQRTIICIPGLGGHSSAFGLYGPLLKEFNFRYLEITNINDALADLQKMLIEEQHAVLFCSCYGIQFALKAAESSPQAIDGIVLIEPFFAEFHWWCQPLLWIINGFLSILKITDKLGLQRKKFNFHPDYIKLSKYPVYFQPIFDMLWHNTTDYFNKVRDLLSFQLPLSIHIPILIIFALHGFIKNEKDRNTLIKIFTQSTITEMSGGNHNIITMSGESVAQAVRNWINNKLP